MSQAKLDELCARQPACRTVLYADIATGVAFIANSASTQNRGFQSALCAEAEKMLGNQKRPAAFTGGIAKHAFSRRRGEVKVFLRNPNAQSDVLCCICDPSVDIDGFLQAAHETLADVSGVEG